MRLIITLILLTTSLYSQIPEIITNHWKDFDENIYGGTDTYKIINFKNNYHKHPELLSSESKIEYRNYDVLHYNLKLDWVDIFTHEEITSQNRNFWGTNIITIKLDSADLETITFDAEQMEIKAVAIDDLDVQPTPQAINGKLDIPFLYEYYKQGDTVDITIDYEYVGEFNAGFYLYDAGSVSYVRQENDTVYTTQRIAYTQSEPIFTRYWMPCNDNPHDKATMEITGYVPEGITFLSNGLIVHQETINGVTSTTWKSDFQMPTYLMHAVASKYESFVDYYHRTQDDSIEVRSWVWEEDLLEEELLGSNAQRKPKAALGVTTDAIAYFAEQLNGYPYEKYGTAAVSPYMFGGMEHQTITTVNRTWLEGRAEAGIIHEVAHHWLGNMVTCATWNDLWINEGGATWSEAFWNIRDNFDNRSLYNNTMGWKAYMYLRDQRHYSVPIYGLPINTLFGEYYELSYDKASWLFAMLAEELGMQNFVDALNYILEKHKYTSIESHEFIDSFAEAISGYSDLDVDAFFNQWLYSAGHPDLAITVIPNMNKNENGNYNAKLIIEQVQNFENCPDVFFGNLDIYLYDDQSGYGDIYTTKFDEKITELQIELPIIPNDVFLIGTKLLGRVVQFNVDTESSVSEIDNSINIYPNPVSENSRLYIDGLYEIPNDISVVDVMGNLINIKYSATDSLISIDTNNLPVGVYVLNMQFGDYQITKKFSVAK